MFTALTITALCPEPPVLQCPRQVILHKGHLDEIDLDLIAYNKRLDVSAWENNKWTKSQAVCLLG